MFDIFSRHFWDELIHQSHAKTKEKQKSKSIIIKKKHPSVAAVVQLGVHIKIAATHATPMQCHILLIHTT